MASPYQPAPGIQLLGPGVGLLDGHLVLYTLHTVYVVGEFGGQAQFGGVGGLTLQCYHTPLRGNRGIDGAGRAVI